MSFFDKFKKGLTKTRDFFSQEFTKLTSNLGQFDDDMLDELEMLLIRADIGAPTAEKLIQHIKDSIKRTGRAGVEDVMGYLREGMLELMAPEGRLELAPDVLNVILLVGVNGTGKTTTAGKLAWRFQQAGYKVVLAAADTFRAAAIDQLEVWADRAGVTLIKGESGSDPASVVYNAMESAHKRAADVLIIDTAGRLHTKKNLMDELSKIRRVINRLAADAKIVNLLVIDATTGQNALLQSEAFHEATDLDGLVITKLDGNAKGGIALTVAEQSALPIYLAGLGEQLDDLQDFDNASYVDSLLPDPERFGSN